MTKHERQIIVEHMCTALLLNTLLIAKKTIGDRTYYQVIDGGFEDIEPQQSIDFIGEFFGIEPEITKEWQEVIATYLDEDELTEDLITAKNHADYYASRRQ